ncbi:hypothetical protein [uncultured Roseovarius sp.]|uniref:hypothetical protein n=1 Tax=uncultured Roseovarius sp. TaxID=293344 RepID=UPI002621B7EA|nr:hypothetical protein [uncultured Roseovarius sp.]
MHRKFIALVIGAALAVTSFSTAPANAQNRGETAAIIAGVTALAIVGAALADDRKRDRRKGHVTRNYGHQKKFYAPRRNHRHVYRHGKPRHHYNQRRYSQPRHGYGRGHHARPAYNRGYQARSEYHRDHYRK